MKVIIGSLILVVFGGVMLVGCSALGTSPGKDKVEKFKDSKNYNAEKEVFDNRIPNLRDEMMKKNKFTFSSLMEFLKKMKTLQPTSKLPEMKPNLEEFLKPSKDLKTIWFGHSSFLLNVDGKIVLVDPVFSGSAAPVSFMVKRFQAPVLSLEELPPVDYILISHDHYDHLDMDSIKFFEEKSTKFITPLGVGSHIEGWGIPRERIIEKDWWEIEEFEGIKFISTPAQHFSGRGLFDANKTLWSSWVIQSENHNIYFSGDTGYDTHFKDIGEKYGPFDVAFLETGQYNEKWAEVHMLPEQAVDAYKDLKAKKYFPIHWGMFILSEHTWYDPAEKIFNLSKENNIDLVAPKIGQMVNFSNTPKVEKWWEITTIPKQKHTIVVMD